MLKEFTAAALMMTLLFSVSGLYAGEGYDIELDADYDKGVSGLMKEDSGFSIGAILYYGEGVKQSSGPYGEAVFLEKASYLGLQYNNVALNHNSGFNCDVPYYGAADVDRTVRSTPDSIRMNMRVVFNSHPVYIEPVYGLSWAEYNVTDKYTAAGLNKDDTFSWNSVSYIFGASAGYYFMDSLSAGLYLYREKKFYDRNSMYTIEKNYGLSLKWVCFLNNSMAVALNTSAGIQSVKDEHHVSLDKNKGENMEFSAFADLYLTRSFSIGGGCCINTGNIHCSESNGNTYSVRSELFIASFFSVGAEYNVFLAKDRNDSVYDNSYAAVHAAVRL